MRPRTGLAILLLCLGANAGDFSTRHRLAAVDLVAELDRLVTWCERKGGVDLERDRACELILFFEPDHKQARKLLGFRRDRSGRWTRRKAYVPPLNRNAKREAEVTARAAEIREGFVEAASAIWEVVGGSGTPAERQRLFRDVLRVDPTCRWAHERNDEIEWRGRWYLRETPIANQRHKEIAAAARKAIKEVERPVRCEIDRAVRGIAVEWTGSYLGKFWRVAGTVPTAELELTVRIAEAAPTVFDACLGGGPRVVADRSLYLFASKRERDTLIAAHPGLDDARREELLERTEASVWLVPGKVQAVCAADPALRITAAAKAWYRSLLHDRVGVGRAQGWLWEGIPTYLAYELTGLRRVTISEGELVESANKTGASWRAIVRHLLESDEAPDLSVLVTLPPEAMDARDLLAGYALSVYLLESYPLKAREIFKALGKGQSPDAVLLAQIGMDLEALAIRLPRWLDELV